MSYWTEAYVHACGVCDKQFPYALDLKGNIFFYPDQKPQAYYDNRKNSGATLEEPRN